MIYAHLNENEQQQQPEATTAASILCVKRAALGTKSAAAYSLYLLAEITRAHPLLPHPSIWDRTHQAEMVVAHPCWEFAEYSFFLSFFLLKLYHSTLSLFDGGR